MGKLHFIFMIHFHLEILYGFVLKNKAALGSKQVDLVRLDHLNILILLGLL